MILFILISIWSCPFAYSQFVNMQCDSNGIGSCTGPVLISNFKGSVSNCYYRDCKSIAITGASDLTLSNITFEGSKLSSNFLDITAGGTVAFANVRFSNFTLARTVFTPIIRADDSTLRLLDVWMSAGPDGSEDYVKNLILSFKECTVTMERLNMESFRKGALVLAQLESSKSQIIQSRLVNVALKLLNSVALLQDSSFSSSELFSIAAANGAVLKADNVTLDGPIYVEKSECALTNSSIYGDFTIRKGSSLTLIDSQILGRVSDSRVRENSSLILQNSRISGLNSASSSPIIADLNSQIVIEAGSLVEGNEAQAGGVFSLTFESSLICRGHSRFVNNTAVNGGAVYLAIRSSMQTSNCSFQSNRADGRGGAIYVSGSHLEIGHGTVFQANSAGDRSDNVRGYGGALFADLDGSIVLGLDAADQILLSDNFASKDGGFAATSDEAVLSIRTNLQARDNVALENGNFVAVLGFPGTISGSGTGVLVSPDQNIYVHEPRVAYVQWNGKSPLNGFEAYSQGCILKLHPNDDGNEGEKSFYAGQTIPPFTVIVLDAFGQAIRPLSPGYDPIVLKISSPGTRLGGDILQALLEDSKATFSNLYFNSSIPTGQYEIRIEALSFQPLPGHSWPNLTVNYLECGESQVLSSGRNVCADLVTESPVLVQTVMALVAICLAGCVGLLVHFHVIGRRSKFVRDCSVFATEMIAFGCCLALLSLILRPISCMASDIVEYLGFWIVIPAFLYKLERMRVLFAHKDDIDDDLDQDSPDFFEREYRLYYWLALFLINSYLLWWLISSPSRAVLTEYHETDTGLVRIKAHGNRCDPGFYGLVMKIAKIVAEAIVALRCFSLSQLAVHGIMNQTREIAVCIYNWIIFGSIVGMLGDSLVYDPDATLLLHTLHTLVPSLITMFFMVSRHLSKARQLASRSSKKSTALRRLNNPISNRDAVTMRTDSIRKISVIGASSTTTNNNMPRNFRDGF